MKKVLCKVEYDTEKAELIKKVTSGFYGDPAGYEEVLYKTEGGKYFLYVNGGEQSPYTKEDIKRLSAEKAQEWLNKYFHSRHWHPFIRVLFFYINAFFCRQYGPVFYTQNKSSGTASCDSTSSSYSTRSEKTLHRSANSSKGNDLPPAVI